VAAQNHPSGRPLDIAVLNVGVGGAFADIDLAQDLALIDVNIKSVVHLAKRVVVDMIPRRRGRILMTSSVSATQPTPYETTCGPSRAFVYMFAESLRAEVLEHGITVTALLPGATDSDFHANAGMGDTKFEVSRPRGVVTAEVTTSLPGQAAVR